MSNHDVVHGGEVHAHWDTSIWPVVISFGILALTLSFMFQFVNPCPLPPFLRLAWVCR